MLAQYNQAFTPVVRGHGQQRPGRPAVVPHSDVKVRGLIVGEVREHPRHRHGRRDRPRARPEQGGADPGATPRPGCCPRRCSARSTSTSCRPPTGSAGPHLKNGDVIAQDKSTTAVEVNQILDDIMPLLTAVKPEKLNATLNALATALQGRGEEIGQTIDLADELPQEDQPAPADDRARPARRSSDVTDNLNDRRARPDHDHAEPPGHQPHDRRQGAAAGVHSSTRAST